MCCKWAHYPSLISQRDRRTTIYILDGGVNGSLSITEVINQLDASVAFLWKLTDSILYGLFF